MSAQVIRPVLGAAVGAAVGFAVYKFVGCRTGACPLTGSPWVSMLIWGAVGAMLSMPTH
jgi:hypothetical protein